MVAFPKTRPFAVAAAVAGGAVVVTGCGGGAPVPGSPVQAPISTSVAPTATSVPQSSRTSPSPAGQRETESHEAPPRAKPVGWCAARDVKITASELVSPSSDSRLFSLTFQGKSAEGCMIGGTVSDVSFAASGTPVPVEIGGGQDPEYTEFRLVDGREVVVYIWTETGDGALRPTDIRFTLPGKGTKGDTVSVRWQGPFDGPIRMTNLVAPVG
ncbi:hypothetical protein [Amycolatopsis jejuensis]|uniref:hypothetical protein n=1 Tax=Amycolatopsis jejuensis TaxID=330084 RepID=UPI0005259DD2|nr:hypothetical protein [Amycolatopsis jejuensis]